MSRTNHKKKAALKKKAKHSCKCSWCRPRNKRRVAREKARARDFTEDT